MADEDYRTFEKDHLMYSLQPFLDNGNIDIHANSFFKMSSLNSTLVTHNNANASQEFTDQVVPSRTLLYQYESFDNIAERPRLESQCSIVDGLLSEIYDRWQDHKHDSFDSDTFTECSSTSEVAHWRGRTYLHDTFSEDKPIRHFHPALLQEYSITELKNLVGVLSRYVNQMSARLVRQLKRRERRMSKVQNNCDIVTAIIQASSPKRRIDTRMRFTVEPSVGDSAFDQWKDAMKAVARLPLGIPDEFRKKVWLSLADQHIHDLKIDWDRTVKVAFNERSNPDDNNIGLQIVKDLHRTGCSGFSGEDNEEERAILKRILLAYARWNKQVGYCQGFNVIAALLLDVMDRKEADAFKVMIYLIDHVLPQSYFANNLRALSVDMAVFRDLLKIFPKLSKHLDYLQHAQDQMSGGCYEPPLTNVFTMQWFLTLFATCLPKGTTLRVWDAIMLDGSEILLRTALVIWGKLSSRILTVSTADEFYTLMGDITQEMLEGKVLDPDSMIKSIYSIAPFPFPQLTELREKYTYNIRPFTPASKRNWTDGAVLPSDEDDLEDEDIEAITCFTGFIPVNPATGAKQKALEGDQRTGSIPDIASLGPGAYSLGPADGSGMSNTPAYMERMTTDISALKKQYVKLRQRQRQAHIILTTASAKQQALKTKPMMPTIESPRALNHLFINKQAVKGRNRLVAAGPRIASLYPLGIPSTTPGPGQPVQPQVIGNTKCKWIQKSSNDDQKNGNVKKTASPPNNLRNIANNENNINNNNNNNSNSSTRLSPVSNSRQTDQCQNKDKTELDKSDNKVNKNDNDDSVNSGAADDAPENANVKSNTDTGLSDTCMNPDMDKAQHESSPKQDKQCVENADKTEDKYSDKGSPVSDMDKKICGAGIDGAKDTTQEADWADIRGEARDIFDKDIDLLHSTGATDVEADNTVSKNESAQDNTDSTGNECKKVLSVYETHRHLEPSGIQPDCNQSESTATGRSGILSETQATETVSTKSPTKKKCAMLNTTKAASFSASSNIGDSYRVKSPASAGEYAHDKSFEQYYNTKRNLTINSGQSAEAGLKKFTTSKKAFNPFPVLHMNQNRAKTGIRLGLYKQSTLEEYEKNLKNQPVWGK